jgi:DNA-binding MarR family transcriptional regulator
MPLGPSQRLYLDTIRAHPGLTIPKLARLAGQALWARAKVYRVVYSLAKRGLVFPEKGQKGSRWFTI